MDTIVIAIAGHSVEVPLWIGNWTAPGLPERTTIAIRRTHVHGKLAAQIRGVVAEHPAVVWILIGMGTETDIHGIIGQEQAGPLDMLPWIEGQGPIREGSRTCSGH